MKRFFKKYVPITFFISLPLFLISHLLLLLASENAGLADRLSGGIGSSLREAFARITNPLPISAAELFVIFLVFFLLSLVFVSVFAVKRWRVRVRILFHLVSFVFLMYSWYVIAFGISYHTEPIEKKMGIEAVTVDEESIYGFSRYLVGELNAIAPELSLGDGGTKMGYDIRALSEKCVSAYDGFVSDYPIFNNFTSYAKPVMLSRLMAYGGIIGMYTYFSGEANISVVYPDYCIPFATLHELAHQRGVAREDEANFVAFAVSLYSDDPYIKYSGCLSAFEYAVSALNATNRERVEELYSMLDEAVISDMKVYSDFYKEHKNTHLLDISRFFNDTYLRLNGTEGVVSYSRAVRLFVSYYESLADI